MSQYAVRPLSDRTWLRPASKRKPSRFSSTWAETEQLLSTEVDHLRGRDLVIELDVTESDLRLNGTLRTRAKAGTPAVVVAFDSKHGPMLHRCDTFVAAYYGQGEDWQQNVRAIALTLQSLRAVDRYGAVDTGQQYQGFKAIGGGTPMPAGPAPMSSSAAAELLRSYAPIGTPLDVAWRRAIRATHPDTAAGTRESFDRVQEAARVLELTS